MKNYMKNFYNFSFKKNIEKKANNLRLKYSFNGLIS